MLDIKKLRDQFDEVQRAVGRRGGETGLERFAELDAERRALLAETEDLRHRRNKASGEIARLKKAKEDASARIAEMRDVGGRIKVLEGRLKIVEEDLHGLMLQVPNVPHPSVPDGTDEECNEEVKRWGGPPALDFEPKAHWDLGEALGILDFKRGVKIAGARFTLYRGAGALLERALINFMLDLHTREHGYTEVLPPFLANEESYLGTGQLPKFAEDLFKIEGWDHYLVPTAEVPVTNIHRDEILDASELPVRYCAYTPCFRKEAGSHGQDVRGLIRQHQFNKVEMVKFTTPETSYDELESLLANAEVVLQRLGIHYRVVALCAGDLGFSAAKCYDIEVWLPAQGVYREISSCSNFEDFQARRAGIRYRPARAAGGGERAKTRLVHTLNGSGLAIGRTLVAILENFQRADGTVAIPEVLRPYMGGMEVID